MASSPDIIILGIESSCDETSAAISINGVIHANITADQKIHSKYGGVVPELASRAHQQNIIPVIDSALKVAGVKKENLSAIAFTRGPGLLGSLLVGASFAKSMALALSIPIIEVNHMQAHVIANFIQKAHAPEKVIPTFPFLCLTVSGGHTQIVLVNDYTVMKVIGQTQDDAAGEAFDKVAKIIGLSYPGGPLVDKLAKTGNPNRFKFPHPNMPELDFSFSGLKTSVLYFIRKEVEKNPLFIEENKNDICASIQKTIIDILLFKLKTAAERYKIREVAIAGGVSANSGLRAALEGTKTTSGWNVFIPDFEYCTDNGGMIAAAGYYKFLQGEFAEQTSVPLARMPF